MCTGPEGYIYVAAVDRIVRYTLGSHRSSVIRSTDIDGAIDIAVDHRNDIVRGLCTIINTFLSIIHTIH